MKRRIIIKDKNKEISGEVNCRDYGILQARIKNPSTVFRNRKKYSRKEKYKKEYEVE